MEREARNQFAKRSESRFVGGDPSQNGGHSNDAGDDEYDTNDLHSSHAPNAFIIIHSARIAVTPWNR